MSDLTEAQAHQLVQDFFAAWEKGDPDLVASFFTEDGIYHNIPQERTQGREEIRKLVSVWLAALQGMAFRFDRIMVLGNQIAMERVDLVPGGSGPKELPCAGFMEIRDGKIALWREYWDVAQMMEAAK